MKIKFRNYFLILLGISFAFLFAYFTDLLFTDSQKKEHISEIVNDEMKWIAASHPYIQYTGRFNYISKSKVFFAHSGSMITIRFTGSKIHLFFKNYSTTNRFYHSNYFFVFIDSFPPTIMHVSNDSSEYQFNHLPPGSHIIIIFKRTEAACGLVEFNGIKLDNQAELLSPPPRPGLKIEFIGNSITAGYGNDDSLKTRVFNPAYENHYMAYPAICSRILNAEFHSICYSGKGVYRNYDNSTEETLPELYTKIYPQKKNHWDFTSWQPDIIVINAGTNDFATGIPPVDEFTRAFAEFLIKIRKLNPSAKIIVADGPLLKDNLNTNSITGKPLKTYSLYTACLNNAINKYQSKGYNKIYRFSFSPVGKLGYGTNWHPSIAQHQKNAQELASFIKKISDKSNN